MIQAEQSCRSRFLVLNIQQEFESTLGKKPKVRFLSSPLKNPGFPRVFRILGQFLWLSCLSMHVHACRCCVVLCAALPPGESRE
jgi:hypothetical protein